MAKKSERPQLINIIMKKNYADDDPKYDTKNRAYLNSLSTEELQHIVEMIRFEENHVDFHDEEGFGDEFELDGEIHDEDDFESTYLL